MSGLIPQQNQILEIACILTDEKCQNMMVGPQLIIHANKEHLDQMDEWNTSHHGNSGLTQKCIQSKLSVQQADQEILQFLKKNGAKEGQLIIAGNSIHVDRLFIRRYMPKVNAYLHYRILDVSSLKILVNVHRPDWKFEKKGSHRALDDIIQSIGQFNFYTNKLFN